MGIMESLAECNRFHSMKFCAFKGFAWLMFLNFMWVLSCGLPERPCESPQYLEFGTAGVINCSFPDNYQVISWFDSSRFWDHPLIELRDSGKEGRGYLSGEYDILPNGSLVIKNVSVEHEHAFSVVRVDNPDVIIPNYIDVVTLILPQQRYPRITNCSQRICYSQYHKGRVFECSVDNVRPAVELTWAVKIGSGVKNITHSLVVEHAPSFSSHAVLTDPSINSVSVTLAVCKATSQPDVLIQNTAFLFLQNMDAPLPTSSTVRYVIQGSTAVLNCPKLITESLLIWNLRKTKSQNQTLIVFAIFGTDNFTSTPVSEEYALSDNGSLVISDVSVRHCGIYSCITNDTEHEEAWNVQVYAPAYPEVDGCDPSRYCVLDSEEYDSLTCTIRGVPGDVRLEFRPKSSGIKFMEPATTIHQAGSYYDVYFSPKYETTYAVSEMVAIECGVIGTKAELYSDTAVLSLFVESDTPPTKRPEENIPWTGILLMVVGVIFLAVGLIQWISACRAHSADSRMVTYFCMPCLPQEEPTITNSRMVTYSRTPCHPQEEPTITNSRMVTYSRTPCLPQEEPTITTDVEDV